MNRVCRLLVLSAALAAFSAAAQYPGKPVRIVVPFSAGGTTDILARAVGQKLTEAWSQPIVIDNRPGASGMIGAEMVAKAPPDGYTVLMASVAEVAINQSLYARMTYDPLKDLAPVTLAGFTPLILVVHPSVQARSVKELIGLAKAKPGRFTFASPGNGSVQPLSGELMKTVARGDITHVPYKGRAPVCAGRADHGRSRSAGFRHQQLVRGLRAGRNAESRHRETEQRNVQGSEPCRRQRASSRTGSRNGREQRRAVRRVLQG